MAARIGLFLCVFLVSQASAAPLLPRHAASANAYLKSLSVSRGKLAPAFRSRHLKYRNRVAETVNHVLFNAVAADAHAKLSIANLGFGNGKLTTMAPLFGKATLVLLVVTAEDGKTTKTYQIKIQR